MGVCVCVYVYIHIHIYCFYLGQRQSQPSALINYHYHYHIFCRMLHDIKRLQVKKNYEDMDSPSYFWGRGGKKILMSILKTLSFHSVYLLGMGRNRYRVLEVSGIGSILKYRYRRKTRYRYRVLFDTISILYKHGYFNIKLQ